MAAITTQSRPVQGCTSRLLGVMRYRPMATPAFVTRWFRDGVTAHTLAVAPVVVFDQKDDIQHRYLRRFSETGLTPPQHFVPVSADFAEAVRLGFGWAMLPHQQSSGPVERGELIELGTEAYVDTTLYWQQWSLRMTALDRVAEAMAAAAQRGLVQTQRQIEGKPGLGS